jgi:hypothetical protein
MELLAGLWLVSGCGLPEGLIVLPGVEWLLEGLSVAWPWLGHQPEMRLVRWAIAWLRWGSVMLLSADVVGQWLSGISWSGQGSEIGTVGAVAGCIVHTQQREGGSTAHVEGLLSEGECRIRLCGEFFLTVQQEDAFRQRLAILFLRQLEGATQRQGSRATRDGRRPLVTQQQLAEWFGVAQPHISLW